MIVPETFEEAPSSVNKSPPFSHRWWRRASSRYCGLVIHASLFPGRRFDVVVDVVTSPLAPDRVVKWPGTVTRLLSTRWEAVTVVDIRAGVATGGQRRSVIINVPLCRKDTGGVRVHIHSPWVTMRFFRIV